MVAAHRRQSTTQNAINRAFRLPSFASTHNGFITQAGPITSARHRMRRCAFEPAFELHTRRPKTRQRVDIAVHHLFSSRCNTTFTNRPHFSRRQQLLRCVLTYSSTPCKKQRQLEYIGPDGRFNLLTSWKISLFVCRRKVRRASS